MKMLATIKEALLHLAFPHVCQSCGTDALQSDHELCLRCLGEMPATLFHQHANNPVEKLFWGRLPLQMATAQYYFTKESMMQHLMHQVKYRGNRDLCLYLGRIMGADLLNSHRFHNIDALVPLPLHPRKEKKRGYNQAALLCRGMANVMNKPLLEHCVQRNLHTESQTKKNRIERWLNMKDRFELAEASALEGRHVLLVDDVVTTGATLEACGRALLQAPGVQLSVATLCFSSH